MRSVMVKTYGYLRPCAENELAPLRAALRLLGDDGAAVLRLDGDLLNISFEGSYFPIEDFLAALPPLLGAHRKGRIDYIDLEAWTLARYSLENGFITCSRSDLNNVLAFSGH